MPPVPMLHDGALQALDGRAPRFRRQRLIVYSVDVGSKSLTYPFSRETFTLREEAEAFIEKLRRNDPELARELRIEEHEPEAGGVN